MRYYKVKGNKDDCVQIILKNKTLYELVPNELFTVREMEKIGFSEKDIEKYLEPIEFNKNKIYWCFGHRFNPKSLLKKRG